LRSAHEEAYQIHDTQPANDNTNQHQSHACGQNAQQISAHAGLPFQVFFFSVTSRMRFFAQPGPAFRAMNVTFGGGVGRQCQFLSTQIWVETSTTAHCIIQTGH
jgi:hypothetical protein